MPTSAAVNYSVTLSTLDSMFVGSADSYLDRLSERTGKISREILRVFASLLQVTAATQARAEELRAKVEDDYQALSRIVSESTNHLVEFADRIRRGEAWSPSEFGQPFGDDGLSTTIRHEIYNEILEIQARSHLIPTELSTHSLQATIVAGGLVPEALAILNTPIEFGRARNSTLEGLTQVGIDLDDRVPSLRLITESGDTIEVVRGWVKEEKVGFEQFLERVRFLVTFESFLDWLEAEGIALFERAVEGLGDIEAKYTQEIDQLDEAHHLAMGRYFRLLADLWKEHSIHLSSSDAMADLPPYREIVAIGRSFLPFLLKELEEAGGHWFGALVEITGENPVPIEARGKVKKMREAWLNWGRETHASL